MSVPVGASAGSGRLICHNPTNPGAKPLNCTGICFPLRNTRGGALEFDTAGPAATPSSTEGETAPAPVPYTVSTSPRLAGLDVEFTVPSGLAATNSPGAAALKVAVVRVTACPPTRASTTD